MFFHGFDIAFDDLIRINISRAKVILLIIF